MEIRQTARAGTLESSDILITVKACMKGIDIRLESNVKKQYGNRIKEVIQEVVEEFGINNIQVNAHDNGALDYAIRARTESALKRALGLKEEE